MRFASFPYPELTLITMMALILYNRGELPRDRPQLYERIIELLLGQWDQVHEGQSLSDAVGVPDWGSERFRPLLDQLSYDAHRVVTSEDGRGRLGRGELFAALIDFFRAARVPSPGDSTLRWLDYIEQRSGLLTPDGSNSYVFAHLTFQEHCAGRHIALNCEDPVSLIMSYREDDRWREPIFLGAGLMRFAELNMLLTELIYREGKTDKRWYQDLILAAEIGEDRDWNYLRTRPMIKVDRIQRDLRHGLLVLLNDYNQPLSLAERIRAGFLLGDLGDPRYPVRVDQWKQELQRAISGDNSGYFCYVPSGSYIIGSADDDPDALNEERPQHEIVIDHSFLIARYPITNQQWMAWVDEGGKVSHAADHDDYNRPNQPVVSLTWYMANDFCSWISMHLGVVVRLPTESEWEAAARGQDARRYPWGDEWLEDRAASEENEETRGWPWTVPVGCFPAGAAPCGALDMAGNVWEWTSDNWRSYDAEQSTIVDTQLVLRGGSAWGSNRKQLRCTARFKNYPDIYLYGHDGFRIVIALSIADV